MRCTDSMRCALSAPVVWISRACPPGRLKVLARYAAAARAQAIARMPDERRIATLLAFTHQLTATAQDDALDVLDMLVENLLDRVEHEGERARLRTLRDLDAAALRLRDAGRGVASCSVTSGVSIGAITP